jgi:hypothetical protein
MSEPWNWTETDLLRLITDAVPESIELDYKQSAALDKSEGKKREISKDVSALANSAGGIILYGMVENGHVPTRLDSGSDPNVISKEWLEQVINSNIQRRIDGVRINPIPLTHSAGQVAYVVSVPQSMSAPHMAADKRYYKRFNFESVPMEDYEVRDVSRRSEAPDLEITFRPATPLLVNPIHLNPFISNRSVTPAEYIVIHIFVDERVAVADSFIYPFDRTGVQPVTADGTDTPCHVFTTNHRIPTQMPVFQGTDLLITPRPLELTLPAGDGKYLLAWRMSAPRMPQKFGCVYLSPMLDSRKPTLEPGSRTEPT